MSKMIRKTLSLVLALSLVYLMSASAFAQDVFCDHYDFDVDVFVDAYAAIDEDRTYGDVTLTCIDTGECTVSAYCVFTPNLQGRTSESLSVTDLSYASVQYDVDPGSVMVRATYDFYAITPYGDVYGYYNAEIGVN